VGINKSGKAKLTRDTIKLTVVMMNLIMFIKGFYLKNHTELGGLGMVFFFFFCSRSGSSDLPQPVRTPHLHKLLIK
jgi:hypothetical protein